MTKPPLQFTITSDMREKVARWLDDGHRCATDSFGGLLTYHFTPCGIGDGIKVTCPCGQTLDLTDTSDW